MLADDKLVKKAHAKLQYTPAQIDELASCFDPDAGPYYFMRNFMWIQHPTRGRIKFEPYDYQLALIDTYHGYRKSINMLGRQLGKSTVAVGYLLWYAMFNSDSTVLIASHKHEGALEIMQRLRFAYECVPDHIRSGIITYNKKSIEFDNGSRILSQTTTENTGRGYSISCLVADSTYVTVRNRNTEVVKTVTMQQLFDELPAVLSVVCNEAGEVSIDPNLSLHRNDRYDVLTSSGMKRFDSITLVKKPVVELMFEDASLECTEDHKIYSADRKTWVPASELRISEKVTTVRGETALLSRTHIGEHLVSDLVNVDQVHSFYANDIEVHNCIYLDEFAFVEFGIARDLWTSLAPTLSTGGKIIITSTPNSTEDQFAELWFNANKLTDEFGNETQVGINGFRPYFADWSVHPDRDEEWAAQQKGEIGESRFLKEHCCQFISFSETLISSTVISDLEGIAPVRTENNVRWYKNIDPECTYVVGLDPAMGTGGDYAAIQVYELPSLNQVAEWRNNKTIVEGQISILREILLELEDAGVQDVYWSLENNTVGEAALVVIRDTGEEMLPGTMLHDHKVKGRKRKGYTTTHKTKIEVCAKLKSLLESDRMKINSKALVSEIKTFISKNNSYEAQTGSTDDLISATLLCLRMTEFISQWDEEVSEALSARIKFDDEADDMAEYELPMPSAFL